MQDYIQQIPGSSLHEKLATEIQDFEFLSKEKLDSGLLINLLLFFRARCSSILLTSGLEINGFSAAVDAFNHPVFHLILDSQQKRWPAAL
jgi:hypothetical protein